MVQTVLGHAVSTVAAVKPAAWTMDIVLMDVNQATHLHSVMTVRTLEIKLIALKSKIDVVNLDSDNTEYFCANWISIFVQ